MAASGKSYLRNRIWQTAGDETALPALLGTQGEIWLATRTDGKAGAGTKSDPFDASTAAKYTTLLTTYNLNYVFMYYPDEYLCKGWEFSTRKTMNTGCKHYAPYGTAVIKLACTETGPGCGTIFGANYNARADGFEIDGLKLDCDATNQAKWSAGSNRFVSAIAGSGSNIKLRNFEVINFGTNSAGTELFTVMLGVNTGAGDFSDNLIEYFNINSPAEGNQDGVSLVTNARFYASQTGKGNAIRCGQVDVYGNDFAYSHGPHAELVENNFKIRGCSEGFYTEPSGDNLVVSPIIRNNTFVQCGQGIAASAHDGSIVNNFSADDNTFIDTTGASIGLASDDGLLTHYKNVSLKNNRAINSSGATGSGGAISVTSATNVIATGNIADTTTSPGVLIKATNATVAENRKSDGTLLVYELNTVTTTQKAFVSAAAGGDVSSNTSSSVDSEIVAFSGTGGKTVKRLNALTGVPKLTAGVVSIATLGTDYLSNASSLPAANLTGTIATARLGSGSASNTTFLRGDQTWQGVSGATIASTLLILKGDNAGNAVAATLGTDYLSSASNLNGSNVASGTVANARLTAAIQRLVAATTAVSGATPSIDWSLGTNFSITLSANATFTFSNDADNWEVLIAITNTASNYTVTWPAGIKWVGGSAPTQTLGAKTDLVGFARIGATIYGAIVQNFS